MPKPTPEELQDAEERTTAMGLARYAFEYIAAARVIDEQVGETPGYEKVSPVPAYFLISHGIELTVKAFLRHNGITVAELTDRKYGHNLHACFRKAKELGLTNIFTMSASDKSALELLVELNKRHELRYIRTGAKRFPSWAIVEPFAVRLHQAVAPVIGMRTFDVAFSAAG